MPENGWNYGVELETMAVVVGRKKSVTGCEAEKVHGPMNVPVAWKGTVEAALGNG